MNKKSFVLNGTEFVIDADTGALDSLVFPGVKPMLEGGRGLFDLAWPFHNLYDTQRANPTGAYNTAPPEISFDGGVLTIHYSRVPNTIPAPEDMEAYRGAVEATVTLSEQPDGRSVSMRLHIKNHSATAVEQVLFPDMNGIVPTMDTEHAKMTMMGGSCNPFTELASTPKSRETFFAWTESAAGRNYCSGGFQTGTMIGRWYDMGSRLGGYSMFRKHWGWGPDNMQMMGYGDHIWVKLDNLTGKVRIASLRDTDIKTGEEWDSGEYVLTAHNGPWIFGIDAYKQYALSNIHRVVDVPRRAKEMLGFRTIFMSNGYTVDPTDYSWKYDDLPKIAEDMKEHGIYDLNMWGAFIYRLPMNEDCFYKEWGGFNSWKANVEKVQAAGVTVTPLVSWISSWDESCERYGFKERSGSWAETPKAIPMFKAPYCKRWSCFQLHDHTPELWRQDLRDGLRFVRDKCGCPDICWDQYVLGDNQDDIVHDIINEYRLETKKMYPDALFSSECTLYYESDVDNTDFTWNWLYWPGTGDMRPYMHVIQTLRPNMNVDSSPENVKFIFMDNYMMNVYPSRPENYNGSALISEYPEFSKAVKTCARLRQEYLDYFADGLMLAECAAGDTPGCRVTGYRFDNSVLLVIYCYGDAAVEIPLELSGFVKGGTFDWNLKSEDGNTLGTGQTAPDGTIRFDGKAGKLYMLEIKG